MLINDQRLWFPIVVVQLQYPLHHNETGIKVHTTTPLLCPKQHCAIALLVKLLEAHFPILRLPRNIGPGLPGAVQVAQPVPLDQVPHLKRRAVGGGEIAPIPGPHGSLLHLRGVHGRADLHPPPHAFVPGRQDVLYLQPLAQVRPLPEGHVAGEAPLQQVRLLRAVAAREAFEEALVVDVRAVDLPRLFWTRLDHGRPEKTLVYSCSAL
mmetsp:Transcript_16046/g.31957  ORF Transcript_16046/g.31957 Transcript_16046/m.31957 type:complete len:209 (-) Transcript_16046:388-1014(-)